MRNQGRSQEETRKLLRLQKFSTTARDKIINDPLNDRALLSRSSSSSLEELLKSPEARDQLLNQLREISSKSEAVNNSQLEHGLRKLREVIVSVYEQNKEDYAFLQTANDVYQLSYNYYLNKKDFGKLGNLVLKFMFTHLSSDSNREYADIYILHVSHNENDIGKCLELIGRQATITNDARRLLGLSLIYSKRTECPSKWFQLLAEMPESSLAYKFLKRSPAYSEMQTRCIAVVSKCYNQISVEFLLRQWFYGFLSPSEISQRCQTRTTSSGTQIIEFKRQR